MKSPKDVQKKVRETAIDVGNEALAQGASLYLLARKVLLAGVGAAALSAEEAQAFVEKLVERGEIAEADAQRLLQEFRSQARRSKEQVSEKATSEGKNISSVTENLLEQQVSAALTAMNIPTKREIDELSAKVVVLSERIEQLRRRQQSGS